MRIVKGVTCPLARQLPGSVVRLIRSISKYYFDLQVAMEEQRLNRRFKLFPTRGPPLILGSFDHYSNFLQC